MNYNKLKSNNQLKISKLLRVYKKKFEFLAIRNLSERVINCEHLIINMNKLKFKKVNKKDFAI